MARLVAFLILVAGTGACAPATYTPLPETFQRGMNLEPIGGFGDPVDVDSLERTMPVLADLGVDHVAIIPSFFQAELDSTTFTWRGGRDTIEATTRRVVRAAHAAGLSVLLKPHLWLENLTDGAWRGDILPADDDWLVWRNSYRDAVLGFAELAAEEGVAALSIGSELTEVALARSQFWRRLTADVRARFAGRVTYAANWDREVETIAWWDELDWIGVDAFWPLLERVDEPLTPQLCRVRLQERVAGLVEVSQRAERPVVITEIGYKSAPGSAFEPWQWHADQTADLEAQGLLYDCLAEVIGNAASAGHVVGVYPWIWYADPTWGGAGNSDFTPRGKPAETVLRRWFGAR